MYKLNTIYSIGASQCVVRTSDGACIPFAPANTDYQQFKKDLANGVALNDAEGNAMTPEQITTFLQGLA